MRHGVVILVVLILASHASAQSFTGKTWVWLCRTPWASGNPSEYTELYIDPQSVKRNGDHELVFWTKSKWSTPGATGLRGTYSKWKVVGKRTFRLVEAINFDSKGVPVDSLQLEAELQDVQVATEESLDWNAVVKWLETQRFYKVLPTS